MAGKYEPLKDYLIKQKQGRIRLTFSEMEEILGFELPRSAKTYNAWWAKGGHSQAEAWMGAGYNVGSLDFAGEFVVFVLGVTRDITTSMATTRKQAVSRSNAELKTVSTQVKPILCGGYEFRFLQNLVPNLDENGAVKKYYPQANYRNINGLPLSRYGHGVYCRFSIDADEVPGVYLWVVDDDIIYIGETIALRRRFNTGYGNISPRNCYVGGQDTNCKMNKIVLNLFEQGKVIELYFHETDDYKNVELNLLRKINTKYNVKDNR